MEAEGGEPQEPEILVVKGKYSEDAPLRTWLVAFEKPYPDVDVIEARDGFRVIEMAEARYLEAHGCKPAGGWLWHPGMESSGG